MSIGTRLRSVLRDRGLSLRQAAAISGLSPSTLSRATRDLDSTDFATLSKLATFCGVSMDELIGRESEIRDADVDAFLIGHGYNLEQLRTEINALIDMLRAETKAILAEREKGR